MTEKEFQELLRKQAKLTSVSRTPAEQRGLPTALPQTTPRRHAMPEKTDWDDRFLRYVTGLLGFGTRAISPTGAPTAFDMYAQQKAEEELGPLPPDAGAIDRGLSRLGALPEMQYFDAMSETARPLQAAYASINPFSNFDQSRIQEIREQYGVGQFKAMEAAYNEALEAGEIHPLEHMGYEIFSDPLELGPGGVLLGLGRTALRGSRAALSGTQTIPEGARALFESAKGVGVPDFPKISGRKPTWEDVKVPITQEELAKTSRVRPVIDIEAAAAREGDTPEKILRGRSVTEGIDDVDRLSGQEAIARRLESFEDIRQASEDPVQAAYDRMNDIAQLRRTLKDGQVKERFEQEVAFAQQQGETATDEFIARWKDPEYQSALREERVAGDAPFGRPRRYGPDPVEKDFPDVPEEFQDLLPVDQQAALQRQTARSRTMTDEEAELVQAMDPERARLDKQRDLWSAERAQLERTRIADQRADVREAEGLPGDPAFTGPLSDIQVGGAFKGDPWTDRTHYLGDFVGPNMPDGVRGFFNRLHENIRKRYALSVRQRTQELSARDRSVANMDLRRILESDVFPDRPLDLQTLGRLQSKLVEIDEDMSGLTDIDWIGIRQDMINDGWTPPPDPNMDPFSYVIKEVPEQIADVRDVPPTELLTTEGTQIGPDLPSGTQLGLGRVSESELFPGISSQPTRETIDVRRGEGLDRLLGRLRSEDEGIWDPVPDDAPPVYDVDDAISDSHKRAKENYREEFGREPTSGDEIRWWNEVNTLTIAADESRFYKSSEIGPKRVITTIGKTPEGPPPESGRDLSPDLHRWWWDDRGGNHYTNPDYLEPIHLGGADDSLIKFAGNLTYRTEDPSFRFDRYFDPENADAFKVDSIIGKVDSDDWNGNFAGDWQTYQSGRSGDFGGKGTNIPHERRMFRTDTGKTHSSAISHDELQVRAKLINALSFPRNAAKRERVIATLKAALEPFPHRIRLAGESGGALHYPPGSGVKRATAKRRLQREYEEISELLFDIETDPLSTLDEVEKQLDALGKVPYKPRLYDSARFSQLTLRDETAKTGSPRWRINMLAERQIKARENLEIQREYLKTKTLRGEQGVTPTVDDPPKTHLWEGYTVHEGKSIIPVRMTRGEKTLHQEAPGRAKDPIRKRAQLRAEKHFKAWYREEFGREPTSGETPSFVAHEDKGLTTSEFPWARKTTPTPRGEPGTDPFPSEGGGAGPGGAGPAPDTMNIAPIAKTVSDNPRIGTRKTGARFLNVPKIADIMNSDFVDNWGRRFARRIFALPGARRSGIGEQINPSVLADTPIAKVTIAYKKLQETGTSAATAGVAPLRALGKVWDWDNETGRALNVRTKQGTQSEDHILDVLSKPDNYRLTPEQKRWVETWREIREDRISELSKSGINLKLLSYVGDVREGPMDVMMGSKGEYFPRIVMKQFDDAGNQVNISPIGREMTQEKVRMLPNAKDGVEQGFGYMNDPNDVVEYTLKAAHQMQVDADFAKYITTAVDPKTKKKMFGARVAEKTRRDPTDSGPQLEETWNLGQASKSNEMMINITTPGIGKRFRGIIVDDDVRRALDELVKDVGNPYLSSVETVANMSRFLQTGIDPGYLMIQGQVLAARNTRIFFKSAMQSMKAFWTDPDVLQKYLRDNADVVQEMINSGSSPFLASEYTSAATTGFLHNWSKRAGARGSVGNFAQRASASFNTFMDVARIELWKAMSSDVKIKFAGSGEAMNIKRSQELGALANVVDHMVGISSSRSLGVSATRRQLEGAVLLYAPRYRRAVGALMVDALQGGTRGDVARRSLAHLAGSAMFFMGGIAFLLGLRDPANKDRAPITGTATPVKGMQWAPFDIKMWPIFNPTDPRFMTIRIGKTEMGLGGAFVSNIKILSRFAAGLGEAQGVVEKVKSLARETGRSFRGSSAPATSLGWALAADADYFGDPVRTVPGALTLATERLTPFWMAPYLIEGFIDPIDPARAEGDGSFQEYREQVKKRMPGLERGVASYVGAREFPANPRNIVSQDLWGKPYRDIEEPYQRDIVDMYAKEQYSMPDSEFSLEHAKRLQRLTELGDTPDLNARELVQRYFRIVNGSSDRIRLLREQNNLTFESPRDQTEKQKALQQVWDMYAKHDQREYDSEFEKLKESWGYDQDTINFVTRNLNTSQIPEKLYLRLPRSLTRRLDESIEERAKHLEEIGRPEMANDSRESYVIPSEEESTDLIQLRSIKGSGFENIGTEREKSAFLKQRMAERFHPFIDTYVNSDQSTRRDLVSKGEGQKMFRAIAAQYDFADKMMKQNQINFIADDQKAGGEIEFLLWHHGKHPREDLRKNDPKFLEAYERWKERQPQLASR